jgi:hypothetical protein
MVAGPRSWDAALGLGSGTDELKEETHVMLIM